MFAGHHGEAIRKEGGGRESAFSEQIAAPHGNDKCKRQLLASGVLNRLCMILSGPKSANGGDEHCSGTP